MRCRALEDRKSDIKKKIDEKDIYNQLKVFCERRDLRYFDKTQQKWVDITGPERCLCSCSSTCPSEEEARSRTSSSSGTSRDSNITLPGEPARPTDQGKCETCTRHALAKEKGIILFLYFPKVFFIGNC